MIVDDQGLRYQWVRANVLLLPGEIHIEYQFEGSEKSGCIVEKDLGCRDWNVDQVKECIFDLLELEEGLEDIMVIYE